MKKILILFFISLILAALFGGSYLVAKFSQIFVKGEGGQTLEEITPPPSLPPKGGEVNVLLLGYGGAGHEGALLTDSIILLTADVKSKKAVLISIPRDLWLGDTKINFAYAKGGQVAKNAARLVTGISPTYFVAVDFNQLQKIIDLLGGITVDVPKTFDDYFYPVRGKELDLCAKSPEEIEALHQKYSGFDLEKQFTCRYERIHFDKGLTKMTGEEAIKFVRSRHSNEHGGDFARSERQFAVLKGLKDKLVSLEVIPKGGKIIDRIAALAKTDLTPQKISEFLDLVGNPSEYAIQEIHLTLDNVLTATNFNGQFILVPKAGKGNFDEIKGFIKDNLE
ncbi:MAG: LCP family protein [Patescibacteria group bacterium]